MGVLAGSRKRLRWPDDPRVSRAVRCAPAGSLELTPESFAWYSLVPALVWALEVGARPKRPAARNRAVEPIMICTHGPPFLGFKPCGSHIERESLRDGARRAGACNAKLEVPPLPPIHLCRRTTQRGAARGISSLLIPVKHSFAWRVELLPIHPQRMSKLWGEGGSMGSGGSPGWWRSPGRRQHGPAPAAGCASHEVMRPAMTHDKGKSTVVRTHTERGWRSLAAHRREQITLAASVGSIWSSHGFTPRVPGHASNSGKARDPAIVCTLRACAGRAAVAPWKDRICEACIDIAISALACCEVTEAEMGAGAVEVGVNRGDKVLILAAYLIIHPPCDQP